MANIIDELLGFDADKIEIPKKDFTIKLRKLGNKEFTFPLVAVSPEKMGKIKEDSMDMSAKNKTLKLKAVLYESQVMTIIEGCPTVFRNENVIKKFKVNTPKELVGKLFLSGEIDLIVDEIEKLSGFDSEDSVEKVKN